MRLRILAGTILLSLVVSANAETGTLIEQGIYRLGNHPDGSARPPFYGLRLDELFDVTPGRDIFTFDFEHEQSDMTMTYDGSSLEIDGTSWGGLDIGMAYDPAFAGLWDISFTFSNVVGAPGDDDLIVFAPDVQNTGSITRQDTNEVIPLWDYAGENDFTFRLGNEDDDLGHRGFAGISGWGWINHGEMDVHFPASDWIFTAHLIPEPATGALLLAGIVALAYSRRRGN